MGGELIQNHWRSFLLCFLTLLLFPLPIAAASEIEERLATRLLEVPEFRALRGKLDRMGIRGWLFGGTAFTLANAAQELDSETPSPRKRHVQNQGGVKSVWDLYSPTQDLDIVIDGSEEDAHELELWLERHYPYQLPDFLGAKPTWEIRLLRSSRLKKIALFANPQFLNIHNDTGSTGLIEITDPPLSESRIRDLKDWENPDSTFARDLRTHVLHYLFHEKHRLSSRAQKGKNPEIYSVIRYLTKFFQEEWGLDAQAVTEHFVPIVQSFEGRSELHPVYGEDRLNRLIAKMFLQARNMERVYPFIDRIGLRQRLRHFDDPKKVGSISWWMDQIPLTSKPEGVTGVTAAELGISLVFVATRDPWYARYLCSPIYPHPNLFAAVHETAESKRIGTLVKIRKSGDPFTQAGATLWISPTAREGFDFVRVSENSLILLNRAVVVSAPPEEQLSPNEILGLELKHRVSSLGLAQQNYSSYLTHNGKILGTLLKTRLNGLPPPRRISLYTEQLIEAVRTRTITGKDFRRILARLLGSLEPTEEVIQTLIQQYNRYPQISEVFKDHRGVFVNSHQPDTDRVKATFLKLEASLNCATLISEGVNHL